MYDPLGVKVLDPVQDLFNKLSGLFFTERLLLRQEIEEFSTRHAAKHTHTRTHTEVVGLVGLIL